jgi:hypothetical protein
MSIAKGRPRLSAVHWSHARRGAAGTIGWTGLSIREQGPAPDGGDRSLTASTAPSPRFAHASEAELSRILDYYGIRWEYEPRVFPIRWNADGAVIESFAPDFYLPDLDLYLELTTLKQSLVRRKNRKLRYLRELYPMIRIKLFYARDFRALLLKYGRIDAAARLIGGEGQAVPTPNATDEQPDLIAAVDRTRTGEVVGAVARPGA